LQLIGHLMLVVKKVADQLHLPNGYRVGRYLICCIYNLLISKIFIITIVFYTQLLVH